MRYFASLLVIICITSTLQAQWVRLSDESFSTYEAHNTELKFHPTSYEPYVMFQDYEVNAPAVIKMRRFDGTAWQEVGSEVIDNLVTTNEHIAFDFDPFNANIPIAYYHTGQTARVVKQSGNSWEAMLGLSNFYINPDTGFDFDLDNVGNPTIAYPECPIPNMFLTGALSVLIHNSQEWGYLVAPCQSAMPATNPSLEYNDFNDELMVFHSGGPDPDDDLQGERWLVEYNISTTSPVATPVFNSVISIGKMTTNPVNGDTYVYTFEPPTVGSSERVLTLMKWDGSELSVINTDDIAIKQNTSILGVHPVTGEIYVVYRDADLFTGFEYEWNVKRLEGDTWVAPFSSLESLENFEVQDMAFHPETGAIHLAIQQFADGPIRGFVIRHDTNTGIVEQTKATLSIRPNPSNGQVSIQSPIKGEQAELRIMDAKGSLLSTHQLSGEELRGGIQLDLALPAGFYVLELQSDSSVLTRSLVIE